MTYQRNDIVFIVRKNNDGKFIPVKCAIMYIGGGKLCLEDRENHMIHHRYDVAVNDKDDPIFLTRSEAREAIKNMTKRR